MDRWYPDNIKAGSIDDYLTDLSDPAYTSGHIRGLQQLFAGRDRKLLKFAEFGVWKGATTGQLARFLNSEGELHLFDYEDTVVELKKKLVEAKYTNVTAWGSSYRYLDSYNWSLRLILENHRGLSFDFIFLDGAHTWAVDALTFLLCDLLLNVGGYIDFDDYGWRLRGSSLDPARVPVTADLYTEEQIDDLQVKAIVDLLVRRHGNYREIVKNRLFQKVSCAPTKEHPSTHRTARNEQINPTLIYTNQDRLSGAIRATRNEQTSLVPRATPLLGAPHLFGGEAEVITRLMRSGHHRYQEFGVGGSTLMAVRNGLESVVAIDSDANWIAAARQTPEIDAAIRSGRVDIRHADIGPVGQWGYPIHRENIGNWPIYIATAWDAWAVRNEVPDLIFVDGRFRVACCLSVILAVGGASTPSQDLRVLLHDVSPERPYYDEVFAFFDIVESINTLRVMKIKSDLSYSRIMSVMLRYQSDQR
jgi:hypothetical protein